MVESLKRMQYAPLRARSHQWFRACVQHGKSFVTPLSDLKYFVTRNALARPYDQKHA
jgi:hypothetical protein